MQHRFGAVKKCAQYVREKRTKMTNYIKEPHTTILTGPTGYGKSHLVLDLIEKEYKKHHYFRNTSTEQDIS